MQELENRDLEVSTAKAKGFEAEKGLVCSSNLLPVAHRYCLKHFINQNSFDPPTTLWGAGAMLWLCPCYWWEDWGMERVTSQRAYISYLTPGHSARTLCLSPGPHTTYKGEVRPKVLSALARRLRAVYKFSVNLFWSKTGLLLYYSVLSTWFILPVEIQFTRPNLVSNVVSQHF